MSAKRYIILLSALVIVGCSKFEPVDNGGVIKKDNLVEMKALVSLGSEDDPETRTTVGTLNNGSFPVYWSASGEVLRVIEDIDGNARVYSSTGYSLLNNQSSALFNFSLNPSSDGSNYSYFAISPSSAYLSLNSSGKYVSLTLPNAQTPGSNFADSKALLLQGSSTNHSSQPSSIGFHLAHLSAYMKVTIKDLPLQRWEKVERVTIKFPGKALSGGAFYHYNTGKVVTDSTTYKNYVNVNTNSTNSTFVVFLASWPITISNGNTMIVTVKTSGNTYSRTITFTKTIKFEKGELSKFTVNMASAKSPNSYYENGSYLGEGVNIGGVIWAPVNCGYNAKNYPYGRMFQWGRPFGSGYSTAYDARAFTPVHSTTSHTEGAKESNAFNFYYTGVTPDDWLPSPDNTIWNTGTDASPRRTKYDPCPSGWRVPSNAEMNALKGRSSDWTTYNGQKGRWFSGSTTYSATVPAIFLPAAGWISYADAKAGGRGQYGRYWTSYISSSFPVSLRFDTDGKSLHTAERASAFSVRCVKVQ